MKDETEQRVLVDEMRSHARAVAAQVRKGRTAFFDPGDSAVRDSTELHLVLFAEAARRLPKRFRDDNSSVPWAEIGEVRFEIVHPYEEALPKPADHERIWRFAVDELPRIDRRLERPKFLKRFDLPRA